MFILIAHGKTTNSTHPYVTCLEKSITPLEAFNYLMCVAPYIFKDNEKAKSEYFDKDFKSDIWLVVVGATVIELSRGDSRHLLDDKRVKIANDIINKKDYKKFIEWVKKRRVLRGILLSF